MKTDALASRITKHAAHKCRVTGSRSNTSPLRPNKHLKRQHSRRGTTQPAIRPPSMTSRSNIRAFTKTLVTTAVRRDVFHRLTVLNFTGILSCSPHRPSDADAAVVLQHVSDDE